MTAAGVVEANATVTTFIGEHLPLLYPPRLIDNPYDPNESRYFVTDQPDRRYFDLLLPPWVSTHPRYLLIHETGHVLAYWCGRFRDVIREWLVAMGGDPALNEHNKRGEMFAEHFVRAHVPEYHGESYADLVGLVPFDAAAMRSFAEHLLATTIPHMPPPTASVTASWLGPLPPSNYRVGRRHAIDTVVFHHMDGFLLGTDATFKIPGIQVSATYGVPHDPLGGIFAPFVQWVSESDTAFHAGGDAQHPALDTLINDRSIGVEVEDLSVDNFTVDQYTRCAAIAIAANRVHGVPLQRGSPGLLGHGEVAGVLTACPGTLDIDRIIELAKGGDDMFTDEDRKMLKRVYDHAEAYEPLVWTKRLQQWLAKAIKSSHTNPPADLTGPDVETGQPFK